MWKTCLLNANPHFGRGTVVSLSQVTITSGITLVFSFLDQIFADFNDSFVNSILDFKDKVVFCVNQQ